MKDYKKVLEGVVNIINTTKKSDIGFTNICNYIGENCPELQESKDERTRKDIINFVKSRIAGFPECERFVTWLEKQDNTNETTNRTKFIQAVLKGVAINLITWIDYKVTEVNMCLSNTECKDIIDALANYNWDKIYDYMKKKLEKQ